MTEPGEDVIVGTTFRAMGTDVEILVVESPGGPADLGEHAAAAIERLEAKWSRFRPTSEVCRLNAAAGAPVIVSKETLAILERAVDARQATDGLYDPTILHDLEAAGYDRSFDELSSAPTGSPQMASRAAARPEGRPAGGSRDISIDRLIGAVRLPPGVAIDLGGIGKGYTADLVAEELHAAGARGVLVNMGGDLRAVGDPPGGAWVVEIDDPLGTGRTGMVTLGTGAIATSTRLRRAWTTADGRARHHLIDPRTGEPAASGLASVTVLAGEAWRAEVLAKAAFVAGAEAGRPIVESTGATGLFVTDEGDVIELAGLAGFRP